MECPTGTFRGANGLGCVLCEDSNPGWWCDEPGLQEPRAQPGYYLYRSDQSLNFSVVQCIPFRACLGMCPYYVQAGIVAQLENGVLSDDVDTTGCSGGNGDERDCSKGYQGRRCNQCTEYNDRMCEAGSDVARAHYRVNDICTECPCNIWTSGLVLGMFFVSVVAFMLALDTFSTQSTEHASTLAAPALIL